MNNFTFDGEGFIENVLCNQEFNFYCVFYSIIAFVFFSAIFVIVLLIFLCHRRKKLITALAKIRRNNVRTFLGDEFQHFVLSYVFEMIKEGHLKLVSANKRPNYTLRDGKQAMKDETCRTKSKEIMKEISRYFVLRSNNLIESPYFGFGNYNENETFKKEEVKHRVVEKQESRSIRLDDSIFGSGAYEQLKLPSEKSIGKVLKASTVKTTKKNVTHNAAMKKKNTKLAKR